MKQKMRLLLHIIVYGSPIQLSRLNVTQAIFLTSGEYHYICLMNQQKIICCENT